MAVSGHRLWRSKLSVTVSRDRPHDESVHGGPLTAPPVRLHILAMSPGPLPPLPAFSGCSSRGGAVPRSHDAAGRGPASSGLPWLLVVHGPARLARSPGSASGAG